MLTVVTWKWFGWREKLYRPRHVMVMEQMLKKHLHVPHRFVCVTDDPTGLTCETMPLWDYPNINTGVGRPNSYRRLRIFSREARSMFGPKVLSIDLDAVILGDITSLVTDDDLRLVAGKAAPYNGSMFLHNTGTRLQLWDEFNKNSPDVVVRHERKTQVRHYGSDQAWISFKCPGEPTWGAQDGVHHFTLLDGHVPTNCRLIFFAGGNKPWSGRVQAELPQAHSAYQQALKEAGYDGSDG